MSHADLVWTWGGGARFAAGWLMMWVVMMLPGAVPLLALFARLVRRRRGRVALVALVAAGFAAAWLVAGVLLDLAFTALWSSVERSSWLVQRPGVLTGTMLLAAGAFQLSDLKERCLTRCRSPESFLYRRWSGRRAALDATSVGASYGVSCIGCCWALMLVLVGVGSMSIVWMLALTALMTVEKLSIHGPELSRPAGIWLAGMGLLAFLG